MDKYIGENIKRARISAGYTQEKLAEKIDVSLSAISRLETGRTMISLKKLLRIAHVLNTSPASILEYHEYSGNCADTGEYHSQSHANVPCMSESSPNYTKSTDEELYQLIQQLPDKAKHYFKNSLRCYLEIF